MAGPVGSWEKHVRRLRIFFDIYPDTLRPRRHPRSVVYKSRDQPIVGILRRKGTMSKYIIRGRSSLLLI
jgi:hypothetical protein